VLQLGVCAPSSPGTLRSRGLLPLALLALLQLLLRSCQLIVTVLALLLLPQPLQALQLELLTLQELLLLLLLPLLLLQQALPFTLLLLLPLEGGCSGGCRVFIHLALALLRLLGSSSLACRARLCAIQACLQELASRWRAAAGW
jgi:hypothetical protein